MPRRTTRSMTARQKAGVAPASNTASPVEVVVPPLAEQLQVPRRDTGKRVRFLLPEEPSPSPQPEPAPEPSRKRKRGPETPSPEPESQGGEGGEGEGPNKRPRIYNLDPDVAVIGMFVLREVAPVTPVNRAIMEWLMKTGPPTPLPLNILDASEDEDDSE